MSSGDEIGYGKPPKKSQFKKGQSGCPDGGHKQRRAKKIARAEKEKEATKQLDERIKDVIRKVGREEFNIVIDGERVSMSAVEIIVCNVFRRAMKSDASERQVALALKLAQHGKLLDPSPSGPRPMVLVVNQIKTPEQWAKDTEGELLPRNPLHGIPGVEDWNKTEKKRGVVPDKDE